MRKKTEIYLIFFAFLMPDLYSNPACAGDIAIIVNKANLTEEVSFNDLVKIFRQEKQYWKGGRKIYLVMQEAGNPEKEIVLKKIYKINGEGLKRFWLAKMYRGEISTFPKTLGSNEGVKRFVSKVPNAVGFVDSDYLDNSVKVLKIDGKLPKDKGYIFAEEVRDED